jgi:hypothetical protein
MRRWTLVLGLLVVLFAPASSFAQDDPKGGLIVTAPTAVGFIWHATESVAIRPDFNFSVSGSDSSTSLTETSATTASIGVSVLFFLARHDDLGIYVAPRFTWSHSNTTIETSSPVDAENSGDGVSVSGSVGGHYRFGRRFGVFGEAGLIYANQHSEGQSTLTTFESDASSFGVRTAVGVALYF